MRRQIKSYDNNSNRIDSRLYYIDLVFSRFKTKYQVHGNSHYVLSLLHPSCLVHILEYGNNKEEKRMIQIFTLRLRRCEGIFSF